MWTERGDRQTGGRRLSRSFHTGKPFRRVRMKPSFEGEREAIQKSNTWGSTFRILQRNKPMWSRLLGKRRRAVDKELCET